MSNFDRPRIDIKKLVNEIKTCEKEQRQKKTSHKESQRELAKLINDIGAEKFYERCWTQRDKEYRELYRKAIERASGEYLTQLYSLRAHLRNRLHIKKIKVFGYEHSATNGMTIINWSMEDQENLVAGIWDDFKLEEKTDLIEEKPIQLEQTSV